MTLLRRAPREVYRLYGEEDFFAAPDPEERREAATTTPPGGRHLRRIAGTTTLLAAMAATGGLIALNRMVSVGRPGHSLTSGLLAGVGTTAYSHARRRSGWWQPGGERAPDTDAPTARMSAHSMRAVAAPARPPMARRAASFVRAEISAVRSHGAPGERAASAAPPHEATPTPSQPRPGTSQAARPATSSEPAVPASSSSPPPGQSEFGFER